MALKKKKSSQPQHLDYRGRTSTTLANIARWLLKVPLKWSLDNFLQ